MIVGEAAAGGIGLKRFIVIFHDFRGKAADRDSFASQVGAAGAGDPLLGSDGAASAAGNLPFPHTQVRPYGRSMGAAGPVGTEKPHGVLDVPVLLGSPARPEDDSRAAWSEAGSLGDRYEIMLSLGRMLRDYSSGLYERGRALRADSIALVDSTTTLQANSRIVRANSRDLRVHSRTRGPRPWRCAARPGLSRTRRSAAGRGLSRTRRSAAGRGLSRTRRSAAGRGLSRTRRSPAGNGPSQEVPGGAWPIPKQRPPGDACLSLERPGREYIQRSASAGTSNIDVSSTTLHTPCAPAAIGTPARTSAPGPKTPKFLSSAVT